MRLQTFPNATALAEAAARHFIESVRNRAPFHVALSGGRIAKSLYQSIVTQSSVLSPQSFSQIHFFFADERCVPPTDPESNFLTARQYLFDPLHIRAEQIHRIHGETDD